MLPKLLSLGREIAVKRGRLIVTPQPGFRVPDGWIENHSPQILFEVAGLFDDVIFLYEGYTAGNYGPHKSGGITLKLVNCRDGSPLYAIFNANLTRAKTTKFHLAGTPLPKGQFRLAKGSDFLRLWKILGLPLPRRPLSAMHDYMGNLSGIVLTGKMHESQHERVVSSSITALDLSANQIRERLHLVLPPNSTQTNYNQMPDNLQTNFPDKSVEKIHINQRGWIESNRGENSYGNTLKGSKGIRDNVIPIGKTNNHPQEQTAEEWLADYFSDL